MSQEETQKPLLFAPQPCTQESTSGIQELAGKGMAFIKGWRSIDPRSWPWGLYLVCAGVCADRQGEAEEWLWGFGCSK